MSSDETAARSPSGDFCPGNCPSTKVSSAILSHLKLASAAIKSINPFRKLFRLNDGFSLSFQCSLNFQKLKDKKNSDPPNDCKIADNEESSVQCASDLSRLIYIHHLEEQIINLKEKLKSL